MKLSIIILLIFACLHQNSASDFEISCDRFVEDNFLNVSPYRKTCVIANNVLISSTEATIDKRDETVRGLRMYNNKNIFFLPVKVSEKLPGLLNYLAVGCSVETISKTNFVGLDSLEYLGLWRNNIEKIPSDAFEGLFSLKQIWLDSNKIIFLNGAAFQNLENLVLVNLKFNECINESFDTSEEIASVANVVDEKCGYQESELINKGLLNEINESNGLLMSDFENFKTKINAELAEKTEELNELKQRLVQVSSSSVSKTLLEKYLKANEDLLEKTSEIAELRIKLANSGSKNGIKMKEIEALKEENLKKSLEIDEKNLKLKNCEDSYGSLQALFGDESK